MDGLSNIDGIKIERESLKGFRVDTVRVLSHEDVVLFKKQIGTYITIHLGVPIHELRGVTDIGDCLAQVLQRVLGPYFRRNLCVCGIGNRNIKSDALGLESVSKLPTKFLNTFDQTRSNFGNVYSVSVDVEWYTNISLPTFIASVVAATKSDCVLLIDSIAAENYDQLYRDIQISDTGSMTTHIRNKKVDWSILGVPVISVGVPTAIPAVSLFPDAASSVELLTSVHIDTVIAAAGTIIAYALIRTCWPLLSKETCFGCTKLEKDPFPFMDMG